MPNPQDPSSNPSPDEDSSSEGLGVERWVEPFFTDSTLWPVLIVLVIVVALFGALILLLALRSRSYFAIAALVIVFWASVEGIRPDLRRRRLGAVGGVVLLLWLCSGLLAVGAVWSGAF